MMTSIQSVLQAAIHRLVETSESPALDAEVLLCHVLGKPRAHLKAWPEKLLTPEQEQRFQSFLEKRLVGQPIAYLTGKREFWSRDFLTTPDVLIPRPETELLIELCLDLIPLDTRLKLVDLGTGSGAIAITLAAERPNLEVIATDSSPAALTVAQKNARNIGIQNIQFVLSHWFENMTMTGFDIIVSNPPYIAPDDPHLHQGDLRFEPPQALIAEHQGIEDIDNIAKATPVFLKPDGHLLIEHGFNQELQVQNIFQRHGYVNIQTHSDLSGQPRITSAQRK